MRYTLLEIVQTLLAAMDSDAVDSINDTVESEQVALLVKGVYYDLAVDLQLPEHDGLFELTSPASASTPTLFTVPTNVVRIDWIKYNNKTSTETYAHYEPLTYMPWNEFIEFQKPLADLTSGVGQMNFTQNSQTFEVMYRNDRFPMYYSSVDDYSLVFDAYDVDEETYLAATKTMCYGSVYPTFTLSDSFEPDLDPTQFSYFINRAKVRAFAELKQAQNVEAASETRVQKIRNQRNKRRIPNTSEHARLPKYGR